MRLWSLHPAHLDPRGLVALWREALLAQAVLNGQTRGYKHHPQLQRFQQAAAPTQAIAAYLRDVHAEALCRGYHFNVARIQPAPSYCATIPVNSGQIEYEWAHLKQKLEARSPDWSVRMVREGRPRVHTLFHVVPGGVEPWESGSVGGVYDAIAAIVVGGPPVGQSVR